MMKRSQIISNSHESTHRERANGGMDKRSVELDEYHISSPSAGLLSITTKVY